jgi:hypothetical protein
VAMTNAVNSLAIHNSVHHDPPSQSGTFRPPAYAETLRQQQPERHTKWAAKAKPVQQLLSVKAEPSPVPEHNAGAQQEVPVDSEIIVAESQPVTVAKILRVVAEHSFGSARGLRRATAAGDVLSRGQAHRPESSSHRPHYGGRDHTSVLHGARKIAALVAEEPEFVLTLVPILEQLRGAPLLTHARRRPPAVARYDRSAALVNTAWSL